MSQRRSLRRYAHVERYPHGVYDLVTGIRYRRFAQIKRATNGMLTPAVYARLHSEVAALGDGDIVEIGGASGAASTVIALAMNEAHHDGKLVVVEKFEGGTRTAAGNYETNLTAIQRTFDSYGVADRITLFPHYITPENVGEVVHLVSGAGLTGMVLDADGRLDRDFEAFWPILATGGLIVVDDYVDRPGLYRPVTDKYPQGGAKMVIAYRLLNQFIEWGLFEPFYKSRTSSTIFGRKPVGADFGTFDPDVCLAIVSGVLEERDAYLASLQPA